MTRFILRFALSVFLTIAAGTVSATEAPKPATTTAQPTNPNAECTCIACGCAAPKFATAKPCELQLTGSTYVTSEYVFRGKKQAQTSIQPSLTLSLPAFGGQLYTTAWMNLPVQQKEFTTLTDSQLFSKTTNELDLTIGYQIPLSMPCDDLFPTSEGILSIDLGYTYCYYPNKSPYYSVYFRDDLIENTRGKYYGLNRAHEVFIGLRGNIITKPSLYVYYDFNREQWVFQGNISHSFPLDTLSESIACHKALSLDVCAYIGYLMADDYMGDQIRTSLDESKWHNSYFFGGLTTDIVCQINDRIKASIGVRYAGNNDGHTPFGPNKRNPNVSGQDRLFWWTAGVDFNF